MKILEAREIGHGILVESDGYISPKDNKNIITEIAKDSFDGEIYMNAILQKYGVPNRNGRVYPENRIPPLTKCSPRRSNSFYPLGGL